MSASFLPLPELPRAAGAYRWFYADVSAGDYSAVCIFMLGSLFSPRYAVRAARGGLPLEHCAVNFALYHRGQRRCWVLSEYPHARVLDGTDGSHLAIGRSRLVREPDGSVRMEVDERSAPWGRSVRAQLHLEPLTPPGEEVRLVEGLPHAWQALAPRARARLQVDGLSLEGLGYHDTNHGEEPLGRRLQRWAWTRTHLEDHTRVDYRLPDGTLALRLDAREGQVKLERHAAPGDGRTGLTGWGLRVPRQLHGEGAASPRLLESSPFYARVEARGQGVDALGEVADFRRFHSPFIRWMAHFRTRVERAA